MPQNQINPIDRLFEFNLWANIQLIELCQELTNEQLEAETDGVYGRIRPTLVHIVRAEGGYLRRLTGSRPWDDDRTWDSLTLEELREKAQLSGSRLLAVASDVDPERRHTVTFQGQPFHYFNWTILLQALYHGIEHRTQIKVLLSRLGLEHPDLSPWDFVEATTAQG